MASLSISSLHLITLGQTDVALIAFSFYSPQPNWLFFWKGQAYTVFDLGISVPLIPAPNTIFLALLLNP